LHQSTAATTMYIAPIVFDRNAHTVPILVRVADLLWCGAGLSGLYEGSMVSPPTSVYSLSLSLVERVGGWDGGDEAIGEDLHMYLKCMFALAGNLTTRVVHSAASQTNTTSGRRGLGGQLASMQLRYRQAVRHMWGALDTGYAVSKTCALLWNNGGRRERSGCGLSQAYRLVWRTCLSLGT
jgi:Glycosyl transferase family group 2